MLERFTQEARSVVELAQEEARRMRHPYVGTEHLLLGLMTADGAAARALRDRGLDTDELRRRILDLTGRGEGALDSEALATLGIDLEEVRRATEAIFGPGALDTGGGPPKCGHIPFAKRSKKVLELSVREAVHLKQRHIGTGHLLLGLLREGEGLGAMVLTGTGVDLAALREEVVRLLSAEAA